MDAIQDPTLDMLVARLADGDRSTFTTVFKMLWPPTLRLCMSMLKNEPDAWDAAQQAMEKILSRASDYDPRRPALPWALAIAAWECRTLARARTRRREVSGQTAAEPTVDGPEEAVMQQNLVQAALAAMGHLSEKDRETLVATYWDEAASGATLRKRRERALARLRRAFRRLYGLD
ncbi:MAG: sigma-70 family RNA polymerase sigma factor [Polyangia bacterium]|jgi:RNA polymerase sigma-70 factor (ECF subfamily)